MAGFQDSGNFFLLTACTIGGNADAKTGNRLTANAQLLSDMLKDIGQIPSVNQKVCQTLRRPDVPNFSV